VHIVAYRHFCLKNHIRGEKNIDTFNKYKPNLEISRKAAPRLDWQDLFMVQGLLLFSNIKLKQR
jgi:hypothetical protein